MYLYTHCFCFIHIYDAQQTKMELMPHADVREPKSSVQSDQGLLAGNKDSDQIAYVCANAQADLDLH